MSEAAKAPKATKAKAAAKKPAEHPKYIEMIIAGIAALKERGGSSRQAIVKYIRANYKVGDNSDTHIKMALKRGVAANSIKQVKGTGASGSFKLSDAKPAAKKLATKKTPKKKAPAAKKPAGKKTPAKKAAAKKPAAKKTPKKKVAAKKAAKKPVAKKPAPKKAAKKAGGKKKATKKGKK